MLCAIKIYPKIYISNIFWSSKLLPKKIYVPKLVNHAETKKAFSCVTLKTRMSLQSLVIQNWQITDLNTIRDVKINTHGGPFKSQYTSTLTKRIVISPSRNSRKAYHRVLASFHYMLLVKPVVLLTLYLFL